MNKRDAEIRFKCLQLALEHYADLPQVQFKQSLDNIYDYVTIDSKNKKSVKKRTKDFMLDMFTSWAYWKPIVIIFYGLAGLAAFLHYSSGELILTILVLATLSVLLFGIHMIGLAFYDNYMNSIKTNYKKLTDQDWDADGKA